MYGTLPQIFHPNAEFGRCPGPQKCRWVYLLEQQNNCNLKCFEDKNSKSAASKSIQYCTL